MQAERLVLETDQFGNLKTPLELPANKKIEAVFLFLTDADKPIKRRVPHPDIAGKVNIKGDIMSAVPASEWDLPA